MVPVRASGRFLSFSSTLSSKHLLWSSAGKLLLFLVILPALVTFLHLSVNASQQGLVWVRTTTTTTTTPPNAAALSSTLSLPVGLYRRSSDTVYHPIDSLRPASSLLRWQPSVLDVDAFLTTSGDILPTTTTVSLRQTAVGTTTTTNNKKWCFVVSSTSTVLACRDDEQTLVGNYYYYYSETEKHEPPIVAATVSSFAFWERFAALLARRHTTNKSEKDDVTYQGLFRRNPHKNNNNQRQHALLQQVVQRPATTILIALNTILAFVYWKNRVDPSAVAKIYSRMMQSPYFEIWRCWSGATAHFEIWHLALNMMALYQLGIELEGGGRTMTTMQYTPIVFFLYNLSLMLFTSGVWLAWQYSVVNAANNGRMISDNNDRPTVGYSAVLFAWMVVSSLERPVTCPIPFLPDLCFRTYQIAGGRIRFSLGPWIQLVVAQVLLPRVSWSGHLAGILVGFVLHWGGLPIEYVQPSVAVPTLYWIYLRWIRNVIPVELDTNSSSSQSSNDDECRHSFVWVTRLLVVTLILSAIVMGPLSSMTLSFGWTVIFWRLCAQSLVLKNNSQDSSANERLYLFSRAVIVVAVLTLITNSMTVGSWLVVPFGWTTAGLFALTLQSLALILVICIACHLLSREETGIFKHTLGYTVIVPGRVLGNQIMSFRTSRFSSSGRESGDHDTDEHRSGEQSWKPFGGRGVRLGTKSREDDDDNIDIASTREEMSQLL